jgi:transcriptional regulator with XRE-family HTH domain
MDFDKRLGALLAKLREEKGLSQEALAVQIQYDQSQVSRIESGDRHVSVVYVLRWAEALGYEFEQVAAQIAAAWREDAS